jgi:hypothetical protein
LNAYDNNDMMMKKSDNAEKQFSRERKNAVEGRKINFAGRKNCIGAKKNGAGNGAKEMLGTVNAGGIVIISKMDSNDGMMARKLKKK